MFIYKRNLIDKTFERKNLGVRGAGLIDFTFVMGWGGGKRGATQSPNIYNIILALYLRILLGNI